MRKNLPAKESLIGTVLSQFPNHRVVEHVGHGANGRVYRAYSKEIVSDLAFKFVPVENLPDDPNQRDLYLAEAKKANSLENNSVVQCISVLPWQDPKTGNTFVVFVCNYIQGESLHEYVRKNRRHITIPFIESFLSTIFNLLFELVERKIEHGDLHAGNVLVSTSTYDLSGDTMFRVTDFGITNVTDAEHGNDFLFVAQILKDLLSCVHYGDLESRDRYAYQILRNEFLARHLIETDLTADPLSQNPRALHSKLVAIDDEFLLANRIHGQAQMVTPFDYPNCEQIGDSHLLLKNLYSDRLLGLPEIRSLKNVVLTGPRGCGKTTVYRALSLNYLISVDSDAPASVEFVGVYYRCDDLYFAFPRYGRPIRAEAIDIPMHFVVCSLVAETLRSLGTWAKRHFPTEFRNKESRVTGELYEALGLVKPSDPSSGQFTSLVSRLVNERKRAARKQRFCHLESEPIEGYVGPQALFECCSILRSHFVFMSRREIIYFVDDYSTPKISAPLQHTLNRLFMHRNPDVFFKLSTESPISFERRDIDGKEFVEQREYDLLNLGLRYLSHRGNQIEIFLSDLFQRRFDQVSSFQAITLSDLLGDDARNENEVARMFRRNQGLNSYHGVKTLTAMCSGDIHYMIRLVGRMVEDVGGVEEITAVSVIPRISAKGQSGTIRRSAGEFVESVRNLPKRGQMLARIVSTIGNVASSYLRFRDAGNVTGHPPHQASRIEPYEPLNLCLEAEETLSDLIRFSIVLLDPRGKSRRGGVVPRLYLRRYLIPHFNLTFSKRDSISLENSDIELLLTDPEAFEKAKRIRGPGIVTLGSKSGQAQAELFEDRGSG